MSASVFFVYLTFINIVTIATYFHDKKISTAGCIRPGDRYPESTLHALSLIGGWPGALFARHTFRHKTQKRPFVFVFWTTAAVNVAAVYFLSSL